MMLTQLAQHDDLVDILGALSGLLVYASSPVLDDGALFFLARGAVGKRFCLLTEGELPAGFHLEERGVTWHGTLRLGVGAMSPENAAALRERLPWTASRCLGLDMSVGLGDRLGIASPGHIRALRAAPAMRPILAQQSIREMERTMRTPQQVIDSATWGVFQEGWREGYGSDADHLKTREDIDVCAAVGFKLYTLDPRDYVDNDAETDDGSTLRIKYAALPWRALETSADDCLAHFAGNVWTLADGSRLSLDEEQVLRAACKYGAAVAHLVSLCRYLRDIMGDRPYEVEVSVDETETPTRAEEHFYIASELRRLGARWVSMAPRYVGRFEKGVDYIGDLGAFRASFARHVAIARTLGPYKLSLHSGSDKFSIYPIAAELAGGLVHLKTAGTSYLEALRAVARVEPGLYREIMDYAIARYPEDKASYHVSADLARVPEPSSLSDEELPAIIDQFDTREVFHVTFGSVLTATRAEGESLFRERLYQVLNGYEEAHYAALERHIMRHMVPFKSRGE